MAERWPRDHYARAVWSSDLPALVRLVCLAYADHAGRTDTAWLPLDRLAEVCGMARSTAAARLADATAAGWLELVERGRQHRASRYRITVPQQYGSRTPERAQQSASRTAEAISSSPAPDTSSPAPDTSSPGAGTDYSEDHSEDRSSARASLAGDDLDALLARVGREAS